MFRHILTCYALGLLAVASAACHQDLGVRETAFLCGTDGDCIDGYHCAPRDGVRVCVEEGVPLDDAGTSDADPSQDVRTNFDVTAPETCGNGELDEGEECDDGNDSNDDMCRNNCLEPCGDGRIQPHEMCDPGLGPADEGACPTSCDDEDACTADELVEMACDTHCTHEDIDTCADGDGCCPATCHFGTDGDCEPFFLVHIVDESSGDDACNISDPGSDIMWVRLDDIDEQTRGYGDHVDYEAGMGNMNKYTNPDLVLNGSVNTTECVSSFEQDNIVALGCGGSLTLQFGDMPIQLEEGDRIIVNEFGQDNCSGTDADRYTVFLCTDTAAVRAGDTDSCTHQLGDAAGGLATFTVTLPQ